MAGNLTRRVVRNARRRGVTVVTRRQWGNRSPVYQIRRRTRPHKYAGKGMKTDTLWAHCSVTKRDGIRRDMMELHGIGMERFGTGVSYNWGIDPLTGEVGQGQNLDAAGAHTLNDKGIPGFSFNQNFVSFALCFIGMPGFKVSDRAWRAAARLIAAHIEEGALTDPGDYDLKPHSLVAAKDCPTDEVRDNLDELYRMVRFEVNNNTGRRKKRK